MAKEIMVWQKYLWKIYHTQYLGEPNMIAASYIRLLCFTVWNVPCTYPGGQTIVVQGKNILLIIIILLNPVYSMSCVKSKNWTPI